MKGRVNGFTSGVLFTLVFVSLIGTAFAAKGRIPIQADYNDIRVTLDGQVVELVDANGDPVEPFAINGTTYLPVRAVANALGLYVGWDQATATVVLSTETPKPQRDGFNEATNKKVEFEGTTFAIPDYFTADETDENLFYDGSNAMLYLAASKPGVGFAKETDEVSIPTILSYDDYVRSILLNKFGANTISSGKTVTFNKTKGVQWDFSASITEADKKVVLTGKLFCVPLVDTNNFAMVIFMSPDSSAYLYDNDFSKIVDSIKTESTSKPTTQGNTTTTSGSSSSSKPNDDGDMPDGSQMVYVTATGSRYHYDSTCNGGKYTLTTLQKAKARGLTPCQKCVLH